MLNSSNDLDAPVKERAIFPTDDDLCRSLWMAVIIQAVQDAGSTSLKPCKRRLRREARDWLGIGREGNHPEFELVCDLAGIDPGQLKIIIEGVLAGRLPGFDFRALKKLSFESREQENRRKYFQRTRRRDQARRQRLAQRLARQAMDRARGQSVH